MFDFIQGQRDTPRVRDDGNLTPPTRFATVSGVWCLAPVRTLFSPNYPDTPTLIFR